MASDGKPRRSKKSGNRRKNKQAAKDTKSQISNTIFDSLLENVSLTSAAGLGVAVLALTASAVLLRSPKKSKASKKKGKQRVTPGQLKYAKSPMTRTPGGGDKKDVPIELVSKMFQACLQSRGKDQKMLMDEFYKRINSWNHDMLDTSAQTIVVNFLFWYYRMFNTPITTFTSEQADHIRYWADYELTKTLDYSVFNLKFDFMYSIALLQRSIPHMKKFWNFLHNTEPRSPPKAPEFAGGQFPPTRKKDNYQLTRYQAACILGNWTEVKSVGRKLQQIADSSAHVSPKDNYMLNYTLRAMEMPQSNANFGQMYKIVDKLAADYPTKLMPPPRFGVWQVHSFKYRNHDVNATPTDDSKFVVASINMKDKENWYHFYPPLSRMVSMARIPREVKIWGRIAQMMSPMTGLSGCLPMTGTWSDLGLYLEMEWTYRADNTRNRCKRGVLKLEREPHEAKVTRTDVFGRETTESGYTWKGTLTITVHDEEHPLHQRMFGLPNGVPTDRQAARDKRLRELLGVRKPTESKENNDVTTPGNNTKELSEDSSNDKNNDKDKKDKDKDKDKEKDDSNLPETSTKVTLIKSDEKSEETSENLDSVTTNKLNKVNEHKAVYDIELIIQTDIEDVKTGNNASPKSKTPRGNGVTTAIRTPRGPNSEDGKENEAQDPLKNLLAMMKAEKERQQKQKGEQGRPGPPPA